MKIDIRKLQEISNKVFSHIYEMEIEEFEIIDDYYWDMAEEDLYDIQKEPSSHDLGQLSDDWRDLEKLLENNREPLASDFIDLAMILRAIGQNVTG